MTMTRQTTKTKNWPATHAFAGDARTVEQILEAVLQTVRALRHDEVTRSGERTQAHVETMNAVLGHAQIMCEALAPLDGGRLVREQL